MLERDSGLKTQPDFSCQNLNRKGELVSVHPPEYRDHLERGAGQMRQNWVSDMPQPLDLACACLVGCGFGVEVLRLLVLGDLNSHLKASWPGVMSLRTSCSPQQWLRMGRRLGEGESLSSPRERGGQFGQTIPGGRQRMHRELLLDTLGGLGKALLILPHCLSHTACLSVCLSIFQPALPQRALFVLWYVGALSAK